MEHTSTVSSEMKTRRSVIASLVLTLVMLLTFSGRCFALMGISPVSRERAKELGMEIRVTKNGPVEVGVELEFKAAGELKNFDHVSLEIEDGKKFLLGWTALKERRTNSGSVVVGFLANRAFLDKVTLRVVVQVGPPAPGGPGEMDGYDLTLRDFLEPADSAEKPADKEEGAAKRSTGEAAATAGSPRRAVTELMVYDPRMAGQEPHCFGIDPDHQRMMDVDLIPKLDIPDPHQTDAAVIAWAKKHRVDAVGRVVIAEGKVAQLGLRTFEMLTLPTTAEAWEKATPAQIAQQIRARLAEWSFIGQVNDVVTDGAAAATFVFQTREGSQGLVQISGPAGRKGVKIRYKVMKEAAETPAAE